MTDQEFDNIPLLDDLIVKGAQTELTESSEQTSLAAQEDLERKIHQILLRHTSQATAEIIAIIHAKSDNID